MSLIDGILWFTKSSELISKKEGTLYQSATLNRENEMRKKLYKTRKIKQKLRKLRDSLSVEEVAANLADYISDRAAIEGVSFALDAAFFARHLRDGVVGFFGVTTDFDDSGDLTMIRDLKEPYEGYFKEWMQKRSSNKLSNKGRYNYE